MRAGFYPNRLYALIFSCCTSWSLTHASNSSHRSCLVCFFRQRLSEAFRWQFNLSCSPSVTMHILCVSSASRLYLMYIVRISARSGSTAPSKGRTDFLNLNVKLSVMALWICVVRTSPAKNRGLAFRADSAIFYILTFPFCSLILLAGGRESPAARAAVEAKWLIHGYALLASDADHVAGCQR
jgi:hypothetical protein